MWDWESVRSWMGAKGESGKLIWVAFTFFMLFFNALKSISSVYVYSISPVAKSSRGNNVKLVMHQISVDKIENPCYWINRCTFDMVLPSILSTQYWESLIFSPCIVIGEIEHFCVPRGQRRFFIKIETKASICSWEVCFCCCTH